MKRELVVCGAVTMLCLVTVPTTAQAAPTTCNAKPVTIQADLWTTIGTEGDDVVAMEPGQWSAFDALGGNDTICLAIPHSLGISNPHATIETGPGDDTVINLMPSNLQDVQVRVGLGLGNDTYVGVNSGEDVYADSSVDVYPGDPKLELVGPQEDAISNATIVHTYAPDDGPNQDQVTFTGKEVTADVFGPMATEGRLDFTNATRASLSITAPSLLDPGADITVNSQARTITSRNGTALTWRGDVQSFGFGENPPEEAESAPSVSFIGNDNSELIGFDAVPIGDVHLGGGNDTFLATTKVDSFMPRSVDGGSGIDTVRIFATCKELVVRLDSRTRCDSATGTVSSVERAFVDTHPKATGTTTVVGTGRAEEIHASGSEVIVDGAAGDDQITAEGMKRTTVKAGVGDDRLRVNGRNVFARGDRGADIIWLGEDMMSERPKAPRRDLLGGPGNDKLYGSTLKIGDRIVGGPGRDIADGRAGSWDYCIAEVRRNCERPKPSALGNNQGRQG